MRSRWCGREVSSFERVGPEDVSLLERCPHFRGWYIQASMELGPEDVSLLERCPHFRGRYVHVLTHRQMYIWPPSKPPNFGSGMNRHRSTRSPPRRP